MQRWFDSLYPVYWVMPFSVSPWTWAFRFFGRLNPGLHGLAHSNSFSRGGAAVCSPWIPLVRCLFGTLTLHNPHQPVIACSIPEFSCGLTLGIGRAIVKLLALMYRSGGVQRMPESLVPAGSWAYLIPAHIQLIVEIHPDLKVRGTPIFTIWISASEGNCLHPKRDLVLCLLHRRPPQEKAVFTCWIPNGIFVVLILGMFIIAYCLFPVYRFCEYLQQKAKLCQYRLFDPSSRVGRWPIIFRIKPPKRTRFLPIFSINVSVEIAVLKHQLSYW